MRIVSSKKAVSAWMLATALVVVVGLPGLASAETVLRIGMTAADIPPQKLSAILKYISNSE